jgi:ketosteroid isomerase-like protein
MKSIRVVGLVASALLSASLGWSQGGNPPASTKESGQTSGHGMTAVEQTAKGEGGNVARQAVEKLEQQWVAAGKMSNADGVAPLLADNFTNLNSDGTMANKAQTLAMTKGSKWETNEISDVKVTTFGNTAIATGAWRGKGTGSDGKAVDAHERWVDTWMKMPSGKWQCIASASAPVKM